MLLKKINRISGGDGLRISYVNKENLEYGPSSTKSYVDHQYDDGKHGRDIRINRTHYLVKNNFNGLSLARDYSRRSYDLNDKSHGEDVFIDIRRHIDNYVSGRWIIKTAQTYFMDNIHGNINKSVQWIDDSVTQTFIHGER